MDTENWIQQATNALKRLEIEADERHKVSSKLAQSKIFKSVASKSKGKDQGFFATIDQDTFLVKEFTGKSKASIIIEWITYNLNKILIGDNVILPEISLTKIDAHIVLLSKKIVGFESYEDSRKATAKKQGISPNKVILKSHTPLFEKIYASSFICSDDDMANLENVGWKGLEPVRIDFGRGFFLYFCTADDYWYKVSSIYRKYYAPKISGSLNLSKLLQQFQEFKTTDFSVLIDSIYSSVKKLQEFLTDQDLAKVTFKFRDVQARKNHDFQHHFTNFDKLTSFLIFTLKHNFSLLDGLFDIFKYELSGKSYYPYTKNFDFPSVQKLRKFI